jgi:hypothetical protein
MSGIRPAVYQDQAFKRLVDWINGVPGQFAGRTPQEIGELAIAAGHDRAAVASLVEQLTQLGWRPMNRGGAS